MRVLKILALVLTATAGGCVVSKTPLGTLGERALPFPSGTVLLVYERADAKTPWKQAEQKPQALVADKERIYRAAREDGSLEADGMAFYPLAPDRYLVEAQFSKQRYGYAVLQIRGGEGLVSPLNCKLIDAAVLQKAGMKNVADDCWLEDSKDPAGFLKSLAQRAAEPTVKYIPIKSN
jgi:hypothetical protein